VLRALLGSAVVVASLAVLTAAAPDPRSPAVYRVEPTTIGPLFEPNEWPAGSPTPPVTGAPTRVRIPAIRVDAPLETLRLDAAGALQAPRDFARPGWYADGTRPGDIGPAVIGGHVDSRRGPAVFYRLPDLKPGDLVEVQRGPVWLSFRVVRSAWYPKSRFPTAEVYGPTPDPQLRLITCGGAFDTSRRSYVDNLVVYAVAVD
jgi:sortase (surface protein transpeptidase)